MRKFKTGEIKKLDSYLFCKSKSKTTKRQSIDTRRHNVNHKLSKLKESLYVTLNILHKFEGKISVVKKVTKST